MILYFFKVLKDAGTHDPKIGVFLAWVHCNFADFVILMEARMQNFKIGREVLKRVPYDLAIFRNFHHYLKIGIFSQKCSCNNASFLDFDGCVNSLS